MAKLFLLTIFVCTALTAFSQKQNVYFLKDNGHYVNHADSSDYTRVVREPDPKSDLYNVFEFYKDGKKKKLGKSSRIDPPKYEGMVIEYYKDGKKANVVNYKEGIEVGTAFYFYPNGKPYLIKEYPDNKDLSNDFLDNYLITASYDSLGNPSVENGEGYYKVYDEKFKFIVEEGEIKKGKRHGQWKGNLRIDGVNFIETYDAGMLTSGTANYYDGKTESYSKSRTTAPQFKRGLPAFYNYLGNNIHYPDYERANNITGTVILSFIVEKDGRLTEVKVNKSVSAGIDKEAVEVLNNSPKWIPGTKFGRPIRVLYSIPVKFNLKN